MPASFVATLKERRLIAEDTLEFVLQRPDAFDFQAGQNVNLKLSDLPFEDKRHGRRMLTIASPPRDPDLVFATRLTGSGFKRTLHEGPLQEIELFGPRGQLVRDADKPAVFIAGGIGITPFKSMVLDAIDRSLAQRTTLLYSNKRPANAAYHQMFVELENNNSQRFVYAPTMTGLQEGDNWQGEKRRIDAGFVHDHVPDFNNVAFYVCGPPKMVDAIVEMLKNENVTQERILSESFWGYMS